MQPIFMLTLGLFLLGGIGMSMANRRVDAAICRQRWIKFGVYIGIVYAVIVSALAGMFGWLAGLIAGIGLVEVLWVGLRSRKKPGQAPQMILAVRIYGLLASGLLAFANAHTPETIVFVYLVVAVFDGFSQVSGQLLGQHRLASAISPGKTIEGSLGGLLAAVSVAWLLRALPGFSTFQAGIVGSLVSVAGLGGDLLASWYKRLNGVKDFGRILPGHGGVLDRFDSLLGAATAFWFYGAFYP